MELSGVEENVIADFDLFGVLCPETEVLTPVEG